MVDQHPAQHPAPPPVSPPTPPGQHPVAHDAKALDAKKDVERLKLLEGQVAAAEAEIGQLKARLGLEPPRMMPAGGGGAEGNPSTGSVPAPAAPAALAVSEPAGASAR